MEAQALWREYPGEIASDLSQYHHLRIADWHQGAMCSYELLELCHYMDDRGRYKTARRDGNPTEETKAVFQAANELSVIRASTVEAIDSSEYDAQLFLLPSKLKALREAAREGAEATESIWAMATVARE